MTDPAWGQFGDVVAPHAAMVRRLARRFTCGDTCADDLTQEALLRAFRGLDRFDGRHPRAWLATILRNGAITRSRQRRHDSLDDPDTHAAAAGWSPNAPCSTTHSMTACRPHSGRSPIPSSTWPRPTCAPLLPRGRTDLGVPIGAVMSRLHRARRRLPQALLTSDAVASCTAACA